VSYPGDAKTCSALLELRGAVVHAENLSVSDDAVELLKEATLPLVLSELAPGESDSVMQRAAQILDSGHTLCVRQRQADVLQSIARDWRGAHVRGDTKEWLPTWKRSRPESSKQFFSRAPSGLFLFRGLQGDCWR
jgi:hypothetical protein